MRVVDLAKELELPPSEVLQACQRLGIEAAWAGADISNSDAVVLRAQLASDDDPLDLTDVAPAAPPVVEEPVADEPPVEDPPAEEPATEDPEPTPEEPAAEEPAPKGGPLASAGPAPVAPLPPTAVGSMPGIIDEITPEPEAVPTAPSAGPLQAGGAIPMARETVSQATPVRRSARASRRSKQEHHLARGVRASAIAIVLAVTAVAVTAQMRNPWPNAAGWFAGYVLLIVAVIKAGRAWYRASTHPEKIRGLWVSVVLAVVSGLLLIAMLFGTYVIMRAAPSDDAPFGIGERNTIEQLRWGYQRVKLVSHTGWEAPAKDVGTCWENKANASTDIVEIRRKERVEIGQTQIACIDSHVSEVLARWSVNEDADAKFPGVDRLKETYLGLCVDRFAKLREAAAKDPDDNKTVPPGASLAIEYPTKKGWDRSDHDITCVASYGGSQKGGIVG